eukprot:676620-Rhodomonas_salina.1
MQRGGSDRCISARLNTCHVFQKLSSFLSQEANDSMRLFQRSASAAAACSTSLGAYTVDCAANEFCQWWKTDLSQ